ncbi:MAG TPA: tRNA (adenosine(37)-N6)-threonylcarbamoyltransferase complex ATPase subunit type 1 TsaE [Acidimicrobiales bacterium]|nr:tRNA (adenosine(37)-N6)-threonylcarbamoyltransferase complex ATPase subunit type 1 TsaE [Acidimicrobiales bacterium]
MIHLVSASPAQTGAIGEAVGALAEPGDLLLLSGELGAGKTVFAQGFARGLGVEGTVTSPTFTLVHSYSGRLEMLHADAYRLNRLQEVIDLALPEALDDGGVALIEWGDAAASTFSPDYLWVRIDFDPSDDERRQVTLRVVGRSWAPREALLRKAVADWEQP